MDQRIVQDQAFLIDAMQVPLFGGQWFPGLAGTSFQLMIMLS